MREIKEWTLGFAFVDAFKTWLNDNGFKFDSYEYGLYEVFEIEVNEYEEDTVDEFLENDIHDYVNVNYADVCNY